MMIQYAYQVRFNTPAFLGNAEQAGQWRTPPFKALLRQWWRVAYAAGRHQQPDLVTEMRQEENRLFGTATDDREGSRKSLVRLRLDRWSIGSMKSWASLGTVNHPETPFPVGSDLYLGYGPLTLPKGAKEPRLKANAAIQTGELATLSLAFPAGEEGRLKQALSLMQLYGTLGGRSRNGWGSLRLHPNDDKVPALADSLASSNIRNWQDCLDQDWPHAIGEDETGPLIWQTVDHGDWKALMTTLAKLKIGLRTQFLFHPGKNAKTPEARHWLSYPVTNHSVSSWDRNARLPNSLRFKVRQAADGKLYGLIVHLPCQPPASFKPDLRVIKDTWKKVYRFLDQKEHVLSRSPA
jgi:CRISPR-associated protein Cmr1